MFFDRKKSTEKKELEDIRTKMDSKSERKKKALSLYINDLLQKKTLANSTITIFLCSIYAEHQKKPSYNYVCLDKNSMEESERDLEGKHH